MGAMKHSTVPPFLGGNLAVALFAVVFYDLALRFNAILAKAHPDLSIQVGWENPPSPVPTPISRGPIVAVDACCFFVVV